MFQTMTILWRNLSSRASLRINPLPVALSMLLLLCGQVAFASENFVAGIYQDATGNQYQVSGPTPSAAGRTQWTIVSTTPATNSNNQFDAIFETGAAVGNSFLIGNSNPTNYPSGY